MKNKIGETWGYWMSAGKGQTKEHQLLPKYLKYLLSTLFDLSLREKVKNLFTESARKGWGVLAFFPYWSFSLKTRWTSANLGKTGIGSLKKGYINF